MTAELDLAAELLIAACGRLAAAGLSPGSSGNASVRIGDTVLVTPTGSALSRVRVADLAELTLGADGAHRVVHGAPTKEVPLHVAAYEARPEAGAVIHLHAPASTAIACLPPDDTGHARLPHYTPYRVMRLGAVPLAPYAPPGSDELGAGVLAALWHAPAMLLAQHGSVAVGADALAAADLAEELEAACRLTLDLAQLPARRLDPDEVSRLAAPRVDPA